LSEAIQLRQHILSCFEATERNPALVDDGALTVLIVGGGPTGVETAGTLAELFTKVLSKGYRRADVHRARVIVMEMGTELLASFRPASRQNARESLADRGVDVRFGERVSEVSARGVRLASGEEILTYLDEVIEPSHTRPALIQALRLARRKERRRPPRWHGNMPL